MFAVWRFQLIVSIACEFVTITNGSWFPIFGG